MSRKLRLPLLVLVCAGLMSAVAVAQTTSSDTSVKPRTGKTHTRFVVSFVPPASTSEGTTSTTQIHYTISASMGSHPQGCNSRVSRAVEQAAAGSTTYVPLRPNNGHGHWCRGVYHGQVVEVISTTSHCGCPPPMTGSAIACPVDNTSARAVDDTSSLLCPFAKPRSSGPDIVVAPQTKTIGTFRYRVRKPAG
jgi:hypothetical protein